MRKALRDGYTRRRHGEAAPVAVLSPRQREIAALVAEGLTNAEIAARLELTPGTVANYLSKIMVRLEAGNRAQVAAWAVKRGLY